MKYAEWMDLENLKKELNPLSKNVSGIPMMYDEDNIYVETSERHNLIIDSFGISKKERILLPHLKMSIKANESMVVNDLNGELYSYLKSDLENENYKVIKLNFKNPMINDKYNPLSLAKKMYEINKDKCIDLLESIGYYIFFDNKETNDPFWENMANNLFIGLSLYLFSKNEDATISKIFDLGMNLSEINDFDSSSNYYTYLSGILSSPKETMGGIVSVFHQKLSVYTSRESITKMMSDNSFELDDIVKGKFALFIINDGKSYIQNLVSMIIHLIYETIEFNRESKNRVNIILDEFGLLYPIKDFEISLTTSKLLNIRYTLVINSLLELKYAYGEEVSELIKLKIGNIIYILANDIETLQEISNMCGKKNETNSLINPEELKLLDKDEVIILMPRILPIKTRLLTSDQISW